MKLCKDCKHAPIDDVRFCARTVRVARIDLRSGHEIMRGWRVTNIERDHGRILARLFGTCGKERRFWEAKP